MNLKGSVLREHSALLNVRCTSEPVTFEIPAVFTENVMTNGLK